MERCPRCSEAIESVWAYCPTCGRSRILESLRVPVKTPDWQYKVLRSLILVLGVWLVVTIGVAFLREAKAVRDARQLLATGKPQEAWNTLEPFLREHPEHEQALFLCTEANIVLGDLPKAGKCFKRERDVSPDLASMLKPQLGSAIAAKSLTLGCDPEAFKALVGLAEDVGAPDPRKVGKGLHGVIVDCDRTGQMEKLADIAAFLAGKNRAMELVELGFVPIIEQQDNHWTARQWAQQAVSLVPEGEEAVKDALARRNEGG
ncbi:MAG TPA: hypothetical protein VNW71_21700 [Thermoanaerobaculia bacterium]|nr:hypothetical protein [Thermoanaerobaculia bacterium]